MIENDELKTIYGGYKHVIVGVAVTVITFIIGLFDGYIRPLSCND